MMRFGEFFGDKEKKFAERNIKKGAIFRCQVDWTNPPKIKRFLIIELHGNPRKDPDNCTIGFVAFNTNPHPNPKLASTQINLKVSDGHQFIDKSCYLDCSDILEQKYLRLLDIVKQDTSTFVGEIPDHLFRKVCQELYNSKMTSMKILKKYSIM